MTGAGGFIGSRVVRKFLSEGIEVICADIDERSPALAEFRNNPLCRIIGCDLSDPLALKNAVLALYPGAGIPGGSNVADKGSSGYGIDTLYHFAWLGLTEPRRSDPDVQMNNVRVTVLTLRTAAELGCKRFIGVGSIMEDETRYAVCTGGHRPGSGFVYGAAKFAANSMCKCLAGGLGIDFIWAKITNTYGVGEVSGRLISSSLMKILAGQDVYFTAAAQNYDFLYIDDLIEALYLVALKGKPFTEYMISSGTAQPLKNYLMKIRDVIPECSEFHFGAVPYTGISLPLEIFSNETLVRDTGFSPAVSFEEGVRRTYEFVRDLQSSPELARPK